MSKRERNILQKITIDSGWINGLVTEEHLTIPSDGKSGFKHFIAKNAFKNEDNFHTNPDAIYFNDIAPIVYVKELKAYDKDEVLKLHNRFWNEGRTPLTLVICPNNIKIIDNFSKPPKNSNIDSIVLEEFGDSEEDLKRLAAILHQSKLDSEEVIGKSLKVKIDERVDRKLIEQLREARNILHNNFALDFSTIHDLLGRSLFTLYLEHRNILTKEDIRLETGLEKDFFELLKNYPEETYHLFNFLKSKFNGDLFPITQREIEAVKTNPEILNIIYDCYTGEKNLNTGQLSFFRLFDFRHIPIELISAIYEEFMSEEDLEKNKIFDNNQTTKRQLGAYYTPQMLVEFVFNEVLPMPSREDHNYNIRILDPACGSGIFLVEGYKRIIERWKFTHKTDKLNKNVLLELLKNNIYGVELHPEAIKITAFSLYLTFLNYMNPREILREVKFASLIHWTDGDEDIEYSSRSTEKSGINLLRANTFIRETDSYKNSPDEIVKNFFNTDFTLIVGNPPWKRNNVQKSIIDWAKTNGWEVKKDIVKAFLAYAPFISPKATIALITSAKVLFNTTNIEDDYRIKFFKENKVSVIANFSVVREVLFEKAKQASALIIYQSRIDENIDISENIIYVIPKTKSAIKNRKTIAIDSSEIKFLPINEILKENSKIFKIAMYGGLRDLKLLNLLNKYPKIQSIKHVEGVGLNNDATAKHKGNHNLRNNLIIESKAVKPYFIPKGNKTFNNHPKYESLRTIKKNIFSPPLIGIKIGNNDVDICSSFIDYPCAYETYLLGLKFPDKSTNYHKAFVCCLNSSLARYFYILISGSWGVDRGRVQRNELLDFPLIVEDFSEKVINLLSEKIDKIIDLKNDIWTAAENELVKINTIAKEIDEVIYESINLNQTEKSLIENIVKYSGVVGDNLNIYKSAKSIDIVCMKDYAQTYLNVINQHFEGSKLQLKSEVYKKINQKYELAVIKFYFDNHTVNENITESESDLLNVLKEINQYAFKEYNASIYYRRFIKYDLKNENSFYLVKPNEKRFWTEAIALNDADDLIVEILNQR